MSSSTPSRRTQEGGSNTPGIVQNVAIKKDTDMAPLPSAPWSLKRMPSVLRDEDPDAESKQDNTKLVRKKVDGVERVCAVVDVPFVVGSVAFFMGNNVEDTKSHRWTVYVRGLYDEDLSYLLKKVVFELHLSFDNHIREITEAPFEVTESGWGEFTITVTLHFRCEHTAPVTVLHPLKLFHSKQKQSSSTLKFKKPVVSETYDEMVFVDPPVPLYRILAKGPTKRIADHPLASYFQTPMFLEQERRQMQKLQSVKAQVTRKVEEMRKKLYQVEQDIVKAEKELQEGNSHGK